MGGNVARVQFASVTIHADNRRNAIAVAVRVVLVPHADFERYNYLFSAPTDPQPRVRLAFLPLVLEYQGP